MGSSNMDVITTGDIEAQLHYPKWFVDHKHMLRPNQEGEVNKLGYFIWKVPQSRRQPLQEFSPQEWRFGLHNREDLDSNGTEAVKLSLAVHYGLVGEKWDRFCDAIVDDPKAMLVCYGLQGGVTTWTDEQIKHVLALDALFLAIYIDLKFPINERQLWTPNFLEIIPFDALEMFWARYIRSVKFFHRDLFRVENQIPFVLIDKVVKCVRSFIAYQTFDDYELVSGDLQYQQKSVEYVVKVATLSFMDTRSKAFKTDSSYLLDEKTHILEALYRVICGPKGLHMKGKWRSKFLHIPSATKLEHSGINIIGFDGPLCKMAYEKNCLCLPRIQIFDSTCSFIRNLELYEKESNKHGCLFHDYIGIMIDLIQAPEDLDLLIQHDVIDNACGINGFTMWTSVEKGLTQIDSSESHHKMKEDIVSRCHRRRYRLWSEFNIVFCSRPWLVLSTIVVVLVTMATLVQTYVSIIGSNKMKPKFP